MSTPIKDQNACIEIAAFIRNQVELLDEVKYKNLQVTAAKIHNFLQQHNNHILIASAAEAGPILNAVNLMLEKFELQIKISRKEGLADSLIQGDNKARLAKPNEAANQIKKEPSLGFYYNSTYSAQSLIDYGKELQISLARKMMQSKACVIL